MKTLFIALSAILILNLTACGNKNENQNSTETQSKSVVLDAKLNGTWIIESAEGNYGISIGSKFIFNDNNLTVEVPPIKDEVTMLSGDAKSFSYKDLNDVTWNYNYHFTDDNHLVLENMFSGKVHATYHLIKG